METSQSLSIESFSYSWLANLKPSLDNSPDGSFDASDEASFIEMDPNLSPSKRFFVVHQDFNFDFPVLQSPFSVVHADELISNGFLVPFFVKPLKMEGTEYDDHDSFSGSLPSTPECSPTQENIRLFRKIRCSSMRRYQRFSKRVFQKYLDLFRPICLRFSGKKSRMQQGGNSWECSSSATSPRSSETYSVDNWRWSSDSESSIYEAVLHCKKTIGKCENAV